MNRFRGFLFLRLLIDAFSHYLTVSRIDTYSALGMFPMVSNTVLE